MEAVGASLKLRAASRIVPEGWLGSVADTRHVILGRQLAGDN